MKINGSDVKGPQEQVVVLPHGDTEYVFKAKAVLDYEDFHAMCPIPNPPEVMKPGGEKFRNIEDPAFNEKLNKWAESKTNWMVLQSLSATEGLEWSTVDKADPDTWGNYQKELNENFTEGEIGCIIKAVMQVCGLNQELIEEARKAFLATQAAKQE